MQVCWQALLFFLRLGVLVVWWGRVEMFISRVRTVRGECASAPQSGPVVAADLAHLDPEVLLLPSQVTEEMDLPVAPLEQAGLEDPLATTPHAPEEQAPSARS